MSKYSKFDWIKNQLDKGEFLKFRNYRTDKTMITEKFWHLMCIILLASNKSENIDDYYRPEKFLIIVSNLHNRVFLDIDKSISNTREIPRKVGLNRANWEEDEEKFIALRASQEKVITEVAYTLRQSILANKEMKIFIKKAEPELIPIDLFDRWHERLEHQVVAPLIDKIYPENRIVIHKNETKLISNIHINKLLLKSYQELLKDVLISLYIIDLVDRIKWFFSEHEINVYSEDLLTHTKD